MLSQASNILFIVIGIWCVARGVMTLMTGKLARGEESGVRDLSPEGLKKYKVLSAAMNIIAGVFILVMFVLRLLNVIPMDLYRIISIICLAVLIAAFVVIRNSCKKI